MPHDYLITGSLDPATNTKTSLDERFVDEHVEKESDDTDAEVVCYVLAEDGLYEENEDEENEEEKGEDEGSEDEESGYEESENEKNGYEESEDEESKDEDEDTVEPHDS